ncbi:MAG: SDR family NAD(P)-dependent oxidoreductase [Planctomycetota bacterium]|nr:MAG: SDR family NAD(P)-dependent oxidoreductase [Planctomycetota bacterium]
MSQRLQGKSVLVTGATAGIGEATVLAFAAAGAKVLACGRRADRLEALSRAVAQNYGTPFYGFALDVRDREAVDRSLGELPPEFLPLDVLVNNAGLSRGLEPLQKGEIEDWEEMIDTNLKGLLYVTRRLLPAMVARGEGHVIMLGSIAGREVYPGGNVYCATKHAVAGLTRALRLDLVDTGVRLSSVDPGLVNTEFSTVRFHGDFERGQGAYSGMTPLVAEDVAEAIVWVADRPAHVTIADMMILPADQASTTSVHRRS